MPRWIPQSQKMILQQIADDERRPVNEREAARRELAAPAALSTPPSPRRRGRNSVPQTQEDKDSDVETWYRDLRDNSLTTSDRREIFLGFDLSTQKLLDVFSNHLLGLFNATDSQLLIDAYSTTKSEFVKAKVIETIRHIATYSPIEAGKTQAQQFLDQLQKDNA
jgi:hypothetical protein